RDRPAHHDVKLPRHLARPIEDLALHQPAPLTRSIDHRQQITAESREGLFMLELLLHRGAQESTPGELLCCSTSRGPCSADGRRSMSRGPAAWSSAPTPGARSTADDATSAHGNSRASFSSVPFSARALMAR